MNGSDKSAGRTDEFVSEAIQPEPGSFDTAGMGRGEPGLPHAFTWRGDRYVVAELISAWKTSSPDAGELYLRRHWYTVRVETGLQMTLYCERQARSRRAAKSRWWLYSITRT
jgi:hypothetical protein